MNNLMIFQNKEFGDIRAINKDGEPWFVGKDVAEKLGYVRSTKAIQDKVDKEDIDEVPIQDSIGRMQNTPIINESGLYSLVLSSKLPNAKKFKRWVTSEVLPQIRKTGQYSNKLLSPTEQLELQLKVLKEQDKRIDQVNEKVENLKDNMPLFNIECKELQSLVRKKGIQTLGGYHTPAYNNNSLRGKVYADIQHQLKRQFGVSRYEGIKRCQLNTAKRIVEEYKVPLILADEIVKLNNQISFKKVM